MPYALLRRVPVANVAPATGYTVQVDQYDLQARRLYRDSYQATTNTGANAPFELTLGQLVPGASYCYGSTQRQVKYAGSGTVSTHDVPGAPACASNLGGLTLTSSGISDSTTGGDNTGTAYEQTQQLTAAWSGAVGTLTVRCALLTPGTADTYAYYEERALPAGTTSARFPASLGQAVGPDLNSRSPARRLTTFVGSAGLGPGRYRFEVTEDVTGFTATQEINLAPVKASDPAIVRLHGKTATGSSSQYLVTNTGPLRVVVRKPNAVPGTAYQEIYVERQQAGDVLLRLLVEPQADTRARIRAWVYRAGIVSTGDFTLENNAQVIGPNVGEVLPRYEYQVPAGWPVGGPPQVPDVSDGQGGVRQLVYYPHTRFGLENVVLFHPPTPTATTGGVRVETRTAFDAHLDQAGTPLQHELLNAAGAVVATNHTGCFDGLAAGAYTDRITDPESPATGTLLVPFTLSADFGLWRTLVFSDVGNHTPCRLELWVHGYTGASRILYGDENPVSISEQGIQGGDSQADIGPSVGKALTARFKAEPGELQDVVLDDRTCRADFYYADELHFTGFGQPEIYHEALRAGLVDVEITATCGLAGLKDLAFASHEGQELRGRFSRLGTLLHCLSRTGLSLPLTIAANLRAAELLTDETPEEFIYTDRLDYAALDVRAVVDALCQSLGGTLVQRNGQWMVLSVLEAAKPAPARRYLPAGTGRTALTIGAPTAKLESETHAKATFAAGAARAWYWLGGEQALQRRAGWRFYTGTADAGFAENAFRQGAYFGDAAFWDRTATVLRPEAGWQAGPGGFPVSLVEAGEKNDELATLWPEAASGTDGRYLESELAPIEAGREALPFELSLTAKYVAPAPETAHLWVEIVSARGTAATDSLGAVLAIPATPSMTSGFTTVKVLIPAGLLTYGMAPRIRLHAYTVTTTARRRDIGGLLLVKDVGLQVRPQAAKWDGKTSFVASGPGGSVRPTSPLEVFHIDAPAEAGLFLGTAAAFRRTLTRLWNIPTTVWARADDLRPAPMLASQVLDVLALRAHPSRLLDGTLRHRGRPPELLDTLDLPDEPTVAGRRFAVGARTWHVKLNKTEVTLVEIGAGEFLTPPAPFLPAAVQVHRGLSGGRRRVLLSRRPHTARAVRP